MKRINKLSAIIDGITVQTKLKHPLPKGFQLHEILSGDNARTAMKAMRHEDYMARAEAQIRADGPQLRESFITHHFLGPAKFITLASVPGRKDLIEYYVFAFTHRGIHRTEETKLLVNEAISSVLTEFRWAKADKDEKCAIMEKELIRYLTPEELEKLADAEQTIADVPRLKQELLDQILARIWEPEKDPEFLAMLKDGLDLVLPITSKEQAGEAAHKMQYEDLVRGRTLPEKLQAAHKFQIEGLGTERALAALEHRKH
jgi:hypothetical protein